MEVDNWTAGRIARVPDSQDAVTTLHVTIRHLRTLAPDCGPLGSFEKTVDWRFTWVEATRSDTGGTAHGVSISRFDGDLIVEEWAVWSAWL